MNLQLFKVFFMHFFIMIAFCSLNAMQETCFTWQDTSNGSPQPVAQMDGSSFTWQDSSDGSPIDAIAVDGDKVYTGSRSGVLTVWDIHNHQLAQRHICDDEIIGIEEISAEKITIIGGKGFAYEFANNDNLVNKYFHHQRFHSTEIKVGDKDILAMGSHILVYANGHQVGQLVGHSSKILSFAGAGEKVITGSMDKTAKIWNLRDGTCRYTLIGHRDWVNLVALCGDRAFTASYDGKIKMWDIESGRRVRTFPSDCSIVTSIAFDGETVAVGYLDGTFTVWYGEKTLDRKGMQAFAMAALNVRVGAHSNANVLSQPLLQCLSQFVIPAKSWL